MRPRSKANKIQRSNFLVLYYERKLKKLGYTVIIGVDEAGRGPLAGPVVAAAVRLLTYRFKNRIDDSKKLTPASREKAYPEILKKSIFGVAIVGEEIIDRENILVASRMAMEQAVVALLKKADFGNERIHVIVDGNCLLNLKLGCTAIIKGDAKSKSIAAASIIAKVTRDRIMQEYDLKYPQYGFARHKGYPTQAHRDIIKRVGLSEIHRRTFCCV